MKVRYRDEQLIKVGFRIPSGLKKALEDRAITERRSINDQVIYLLEQALKEEEKT